MRSVGCLIWNTLYQTRVHFACFLLLRGLRKWVIHLPCSHQMCMELHFMHPPDVLVFLRCWFSPRDLAFVESFSICLLAPRCESLPQSLSVLVSPFLSEYHNPKRNPCNLSKSCMFEIYNIILQYLVIYSLGFPNSCFNDLRSSINLYCSLDEVVLHPFFKPLLIIEETIILRQQVPIIAVITEQSVHYVHPSSWLHTILLQVAFCVTDPLVEYYKLLCS